MSPRSLRMVGVAAALALTVAGTLAASTGSREIPVTFRHITLWVSGRQVTTDTEPFIHQGRVYVPLRTVAEALGASVQWDEANSRVLISPAGESPGRIPRPFPASDPWNQDISRAPVDPNSDRLIAAIGLDRNLHPDFGSGYWNGSPIGICYNVVSGSQPRVEIEFTAYGDESDPGPYPIPPDACIEGGPQSDGDRHVLVVDRDNLMLYELFRAFPVDGGKRWLADSGAVWDLRNGTVRPKGWTSADAAGLPIFPGLVRYDEVEAGEIAHALRFTAPRTRKAFVAPASHWASSSTDPNLPPMGMRVRLKATVDISGYSPRVQVILRALKTYGMILADNGSPWFISGVHDPRWNDEELAELKRLKGRDFEVVKMDQIVTPENISE